MQMCGCFPYKISATSAAPVFSLPLCLWSIFLLMLTGAINCVAFKEMFLMHITSNVGTTVYVYAMITTLVTLLMSLIIFAVKSDELCDILHDMSQIKGVTLPPTYRWYCKKKTLLTLLLIIVFSIIMQRFNSAQMNMPIIGNMLIFSITIINGMSFLLPEEVSSMVFNLLARRLLVATETTVATVSALLTPDGSFQCESDVKTAMVKLRDLEAVIREVGRKGKARHIISHAHTNIFTNKSLHTPLS